MLRIKYIELFKKWQGASIDQVMQGDPRFQYLYKCQQHLNLALPLLDKVRGKTLYLCDYTLDIGHCRALAYSCSLFDKSINRVSFDNCGIDDREFAAILQGLDKLSDFKSITYKRNIFDALSLEAIKPLFRKRLPNHLEELVLIDLQISKPILNSLLDTIIMRSQIVKLGLVRVNIADQSFKKLQHYFENSGLLEEIDLTWTEIG